MNIERFTELVEAETAVLFALREVAADLRTGNESNIDKAVINAAIRHDVWPPALLMRVNDLRKQSEEPVMRRQP